MKKYQLYTGLSLASLLMWYLTKQQYTFFYNDIIHHFTEIPEAYDNHSAKDFTNEGISIALNQPHEMLFFGASLGLIIFAIYDFFYSKEGN